MKLFIPRLGTRLKLLEDWEFTLYNEGRNFDVWEPLTRTPWSTPYTPAGYELNDAPAVLEAGTVLSVARIYIRQGQSDFNSVTFNIIETSNPALIPIKKGGTFNGQQRRFWVTLDDANTLEVEKVNV